MQPTLRPARPEDQDFLFQLYASTRMAEIAPLGWDESQKRAFLTLQFKAQQRWYETAYPLAEENIVMLDPRPVGRLILSRQDDAMILVDIALLPENRGQGFGTHLLQNVMRQCRSERLPLRLQVLKKNRAHRLYERLGFVTTGDDQVYLQMEWRPGEVDETGC